MATSLILLFAANNNNNNLPQTIVSILFVLVWVIGLLARWFGQAQEQNKLPKGGAAKPLVSQTELQEFLREYSNRPENKPVAVTKPTKKMSRQERKANKQSQQVRSTPVSQRHLQSSVENRHAPVLQSAMQQHHLSVNPSIAQRNQANRSEAYRSRPTSSVNSQISAMIRNKQIRQSFMIGQLLQTPVALGGQGGSALNIFDTPAGLK